jgi:hypothetical protein
MCIADLTSSCNLTFLNVRVFLLGYHQRITHVSLTPFFVPIHHFFVPIHPDRVREINYDRGYSVPSVLLLPEATNHCCSDCKFLLNKEWSMQRHPQFKKKEDLLEAVKTDPDIRQDHSAGVERYRVAKKRAKAAGRRRVTDDGEYMKPPTIVQKQGKSFLQLCEPDVDFMPDYVYARDVGGGKKPQDLGKPTVSVKRLNGIVLKGVVFMAQGIHPPPGCFRIKQGDEFATLKFQDVANTADEVFAGETNDALKKAMAQQDLIGAARSKRGDNFGETEHYSAKGVYNSLADLQAELEVEKKENEPDKGKADESVSGGGSAKPAAVISKRAFKEADLLDDSSDEWGGAAVVESKQQRESKPQHPSGPASSGAAGASSVQQGVVKPRKVQKTQGAVGVTSRASQQKSPKRSDPDNRAASPQGQPQPKKPRKSSGLEDDLACVMDKSEILDSLSGYSTRVKAAAEKACEVLEALLDDDILRKLNTGPFTTSKSKLETQLRQLEVKRDPVTQLACQTLQSLSDRLERGAALVTALKGAKNEDTTAKGKRKRVGNAAAGAVVFDHQIIEMALARCMGCNDGVAIGAWMRCFEIKCKARLLESAPTSVRLLNLDYREDSEVTLAAFIERGIESVEIQEMQKDGFKAIYFEAISNDVPEEQIRLMVDNTKKEDLPEEEQAEYHTLWCLLYMEEAGQTAVKHALSKCRLATSGLPFQLRYKPAGQAIRTKAANWANSKVAGSQLVSKFKRLQATQEDLEKKGVTTLPEWAPLGAGYKSLLSEAEGNVDFLTSQAAALEAMRKAIEQQFEEEKEYVETALQTAAKELFVAEGEFEPDQARLAATVKALQDMCKAIASHCQRVFRSNIVVVVGYRSINQT